jgi:hypothetical protein
MEERGGPNTGSEVAAHMVKEVRPRLARQPNQAIWRNSLQAAAVAAGVGFVLVLINTVGKIASTGIAPRTIAETRHLPSNAKGTSLCLHSVASLTADLPICSYVGGFYVALNTEYRPEMRFCTRERASRLRGWAPFRA